MTPTPNPPALLPGCPLCGDDVTEEQGFADNFGSGPYIYVSCGTCTYQADVPDHRRLQSTPAEPKVSREGSCALGVGCDEAGVCYADAHNRPDQCGRPVGPAPEANRSLRLRLADCRQAMHDAATRGDILDEAKRAFALMGEAIDALSNPPADGDGWREALSRTANALHNAATELHHLHSEQAGDYAAIASEAWSILREATPPSAPLGAGGSEA